MTLTHLVLLIGIPGSGKTSLATQLALNANGCVVSTDRIRAGLFGDESTQGPWGLVWREVQNQFATAVLHIHLGQAAFAIYDATNARRRSRREAVLLARRSGFDYITAVWLNLLLQVCLERNQQRLRQVPEPVIQRMHRQVWCCPPRLDEGFDRVLHADMPLADVADLTKQFEVKLMTSGPASRCCTLRPASSIDS